MTVESKHTSPPSKLSIEYADEIRIIYDVSPSTIRLVETTEKQIMLRSPGAAMIIKKMKSIDSVIHKFCEELMKINLNKYHDLYAADSEICKYVELKNDHHLYILDYALGKIMDEADGFPMDSQSRHLVAEPMWVADARAWQRRFKEEEAREARGERPRRRRASARRAAGISPSAQPMSAPAMKASTTL